MKTLKHQHNNPTPLHTMIKKYFSIALAVLFIWTGMATDTVYAGTDTDVTTTSAINTETGRLYETLLSENRVPLPDYKVFELALKGYRNLKAGSKVKKDILTVIDFSKSSNEKRLWVIDLKTRKVLFNDYVAHGRNSGNEYARRFSDRPDSHMSSIGFYITGNTYTGRHGLSLILDGKDAGYNTHARQRAIVMHGANYVSADFIKKYGRLGRSNGCPSIPMDIYQDVIKTIRGGSTLFIYYPDQDFIQRSVVLNPATHVG